jgi:hypothetical protein
MVIVTSLLAIQTLGATVESGAGDELRISRDHMLIAPLHQCQSVFESE